MKWRFLALCIILVQPLFIHAQPSRSVNSTECDESSRPSADPIAEKRGYFENLLAHADSASLNEFMVFWLPDDNHLANTDDTQLATCGHQKRCALDTIYSWGPDVKLKALEQALPDGESWSGSPNPGYVLDTSFSAVATFAYGPVPVRVKVRLGNVLINPALEQIVTDGDFIESWSFGTPEHYDEIVRDYLRYKSGKQWFGFWATQDASEGNNYKLFLPEKLDGHEFTEQKLKQALAGMIRMIINGEGRIFFARGVCRSRKSAFETHYPTYVDPSQTTVTP